MNVLGIRTWADARAFFHTLAPVLFAALVSYGVLDSDHAVLWCAAAVAVLSPALATVNTTNGFRQWFYPALGGATALLTGYGVLTDNQVAPLLAIVTAVIGSGVAAANTPTS